MSVQNVAPYYFTKQRSLSNLQTSYPRDLQSWLASTDKSIVFELCSSFKTATARRKKSTKQLVDVHTSLRLRPWLENARVGNCVKY